MRVRQLQNDDREAWNCLVESESSFSLLQSWEWGDFKEKLGWKAFRLAAEEKDRLIAGAQLLIKVLIPGVASIAYLPRGPIGTWLDPEITHALVFEIHKVAQDHKAVFLKSEPPLLDGPRSSQVLRQLNFRPSTYTNQPRATIIIDLSQDLDTVLAQMHQKARYNIRLAAKKDVRIRLGNQADLNTFLELLQITGRRGGFTPRGMLYYQNLWETFASLDQVRLFVAMYRGKSIAMNMSAICGAHAVYLYGAASGEYQNLQPNSLLMWEAMRWAKARNCVTFDLWGIPDEIGRQVFEGNPLPRSTRTDELWGVYEFKRKFSEKVVYYTGAYDYVYNPVLYGMISNNFVNLNTVEKLSSVMDRFNRTSFMRTATSPGE